MGGEWYVKISAIKERYLNPKIQTLQNQLIELHKFKYDKIQKVDPRIDSDKLFEGNFCPFFYEYKDKLRNGIAFDLLVRGINRISGGGGGSSW